MPKAATKVLDPHHKIVIPSIDESEWQIFDYGASGKSVIEEWYQNELSFYAQTVFEALLKSIRRIPSPASWVGNRGQLKGAAAAQGVFELGFHADKRQYRIFCVTRPGRQLVLLLGCYHKQDNYKPAEAIATGTKRAKHVHEGTAALCERSFDSSI